MCNNNNNYIIIKSVYIVNSLFIGQLGFASPWMGFSANLLAIKGELPLGTKGTLLLPKRSKENLYSMINSTTESTSNHIVFIEVFTL